MKARRQAAAGDAAGSMGFSLLSHRLLPVQGACSLSGFRRELPEGRMVTDRWQI
jgi:hypothetical protein